MQINYVANVVRAGRRIALSIVRTRDGKEVRGIVVGAELMVRCEHALSSLAGDNAWSISVVDVPDTCFDRQAEGWEYWGQSSEELVPAIVKALDGTDGQADEAELVRALTRAYHALAKDPHWRISTLRLDIIRVALRNRGVTL